MDQWYVIGPHSLTVFAQFLSLLQQKRVFLGTFPRWESVTFQSCHRKWKVIFSSFIYIRIYSTVQHGDPVTCIHSFFSYYMFHRKWLDKSSQCYTAGSHCSSNLKATFCNYFPKLPVPPTPSLSRVATTSLFSKSTFSFLWKGSFVPYIIFQI